MLWFSPSQDALVSSSESGPSILCNWAMTTVANPSDRLTFIRKKLLAVLARTWKMLNTSSTMLTFANFFQNPHYSYIQEHLKPSPSIFIFPCFFMIYQPCKKKKNCCQGLIPKPGMFSDSWVTLECMNGKACKTEFCYNTKIGKERGNSYRKNEDTSGWNSHKQAEASLEHFEDCDRESHLWLVKRSVNFPCVCVCLSSGDLLIFSAVLWYP